MQIDYYERRLPSINNLLNDSSHHSIDSGKAKSEWNEPKYQPFHLASNSPRTHSSPHSSILTGTSILPAEDSLKPIYGGAYNDTSYLPPEDSFGQPLDDKAILEPREGTLKARQTSIRYDQSQIGCHTSNNSRGSYHQLTSELPSSHTSPNFSSVFSQGETRQKPGAILGESIRMHLAALPSDDVLSFDQLTPTTPQFTLSKEQQARQRAIQHKEKESARRDVQKSLSLCLKHVTPPYVLPCTAYRHSKNNVEEPANLVTYDRALLHIVNLEKVCGAMVERGIVSQQQLDQVYANAIPASVEAVRCQLQHAEEYILQVRENKKRRGSKCELRHHAAFDGCAQGNGYVHGVRASQ